MKINWYVLFRWIPMLRSDLERMREYLLLIYPNEEQKAARQAASHCAKNIAIVGVGILFYMWAGWNYVSECCLALCTCFMLCRYQLFRAVEKEEVNLLLELERFLEELKFQYQACGRIDEALEVCIGTGGIRMCAQGKNILQALENDEEHQFANRFLELLYALCRSIYEYGDQHIDNSSVCISHLALIKEAVVAEQLQRQKAEHRFSGLLVICMLPLPFVKVIELWAVSNMQELKLYYQGLYGVLTVLLICGISVTCFLVVQKLRYDVLPPEPERPWVAAVESISLIDRFLSWQINRNYTANIRKHRILKECSVRQNIKQFLLLQYITAFVTAVVLLGMVLNLRVICRQTIVLQSEHMVQGIYEIQGRQREEVAGLVKDAVTGRIVLQKGELEKYKMSEEVESALISETEEAHRDWRQWKYRWYLFLLPAAGGLAAYHGRYWLLLLKRRDNMLKRAEEILVFQSLILFLMHIEGMTVGMIAEWLEQFSYYFRSVMEQAVYRLSYEDYHEVEILKEQETNLGMSIILDGMLSCDQVAVSEAFSQQAADYHDTCRQYLQDQEQYVQDKSAVSGVIGFVPLHITVAVKLIVPFVLEGISQLSSYAGSMKKFM